MAVSVVMPALEMAQETGKLVSWLKKEGEQVRKGDMLLEIETDKAVVEVEAAADGLLGGITAKPGDVIQVGKTIAWLLKPGESVPAIGTGDSQTGRRTDANVSRGADSDVGQVLSDPAARARISPKARRLAQEKGVDITRVTGTGPGGEILAEDILAAVRLKPDTTTDSTHSYVVSGFSRTEQPTSVGRLMAERTTESWTTVPHFFVTRHVDATALNDARARVVAGGTKVTHTDLLVSAVARTLKKHPRLNASWKADAVVIHDRVNVALAMAVENAVVTAVIANADTLDIAAIAEKRAALADRSHAGRLQPDDITGATFTISNLGMFGVDAFTAIIVPPQAAILAVGAIADRVVALDGKPTVRPMVTLTLSCDHRVVDGARAAGFLRDLTAALGE
jgi:pyruvate dehydrogenase E2 component (dihydrolipoamide acetyltransferase)